MVFEEIMIEIMNEIYWDGKIWGSMTGYYALFYNDVLVAIELRFQ